MLFDRRQLAGMALMALATPLRGAAALANVAEGDSISSADRNAYQFKSYPEIYSSTRQNVKFHDLASGGATIGQVAGRDPKPEFYKGAKTTSSGSGF
jgi:hypothetical protein